MLKREPWAKSFFCREVTSEFIRVCGKEREYLDSN